MLRNRIYEGRIEVPGFGVSAEGDFAPLVSEELFQCVQRLLDGKGVALKPHQSNHPDFPLRRFVACAECGTPLTGSRSTGRSRRYPYYHCRFCGVVRVRKEHLESAFVALLERLQPDVAYMRLFREIVLDAWKDRQVGVTRMRRAVERRVTNLGERLDQVEEAFLYKHTVDQVNYEGCVATSGLRRQDGPPLASTVPGPPSCPATIRSNGASSNPPSSSSAFGGTCGMP